MSAIEEYKDKEIKVMLYFYTGQVWVKYIRKSELKEYIKTLEKLKEFGAIVDYKIEE